MITVTLPFDENDPMYARNCGSRKTDVYLFEIAGSALACDMGGVSPNAEHIPDTIKGLTRVRKEEGASNVLFALKEGKTAREIGELALDMIRKRNDIETETEYLFYYNHLWVNMLRNFFVFAGEESATRENMSYLAQFLPDEKFAWYPFNAMRRMFTAYFENEGNRLRLLLFLRSLCRGSVLALSSYHVEKQLQGNYEEENFPAFRRTWCQFTGKSSTGPRKNLEKIVEMLGGGVVGKGARPDLLIWCEEGSPSYKYDKIGGKLAHAFEPDSGTLVIPEEVFWKEAEKETGKTKEQILEEVKG